jgi:hypothetical protein
VPSQADSRNLSPCAGPGTGAAIRAIRDVAVVPTGTDDATADDFRDHPPAESADLGRGLTIERLSDAEYELVMAAARPRGHFFYAEPQWGQRYAFVRRVERAQYDEAPYAWDSDKTLSYALALARLVRDTSHCAEFAVRFVDFGDDAQQVIPLYGFESRLAYRYSRTRDWLDAAEAQELAALLVAFWQVEPEWPDRIRRAIRQCERASQTPFLQESQPRIITGLESIVNTSRQHVSKQFRERVVALAAEVDVEGISKSLADRQYAARSQAYHGSDVALFSGHPGSAAPDLTDEQRRALEETARLQLVLRRAARRMIEDGDFRELLASEDLVRERFPVHIRRGWLRRRSRI